MTFWSLKTLWCNEILSVNPTFCSKAFGPCCHARVWAWLTQINSHIEVRQKNHRSKGADKLQGWQSKRDQMHATSEAERSNGKKVCVASLTTGNSLHLCSVHLANLQSYSQSKTTETQKIQRYYPGTATTCDVCLSENAAQESIVERQCPNKTAKCGWRLPCCSRENSQLCMNI